MSLPPNGSSGSSSSGGPVTPPQPTRADTTRKRTLSSVSDQDTEIDLEELKRPRLTGSASFSGSIQESFRSDSTYSLLRTPTKRRPYPGRPRLLSAASSYSDISTSRRSEADEALQTGFALMRSTSVSSIDIVSHRSASPAVPLYPETSAMRNMRAGKVFVDFFVTATGEEAAKTWPVSWSVNNILVFGRGNRVHYKSLATATNEDVAQLCKLRESAGDLRLLECAGKDQPHTVAAGTSTGCIQIWDISAKKNTASWQVNGASVMKWNNHTLTVGLQKGTIKHYDSRTPKSKETIKRVTRHQAKITSLAWNAEGRLYASGDETGVVLCWDIRQPGVPVEEVGDMVQRRRKIQHTGAVTALAWCPWQTKILATGDSTPEKTGTIRVWTVGASSSMYQFSHPDKIELDAPVTSLHFSSHCKEILSTHGPGKTTPAPQTYTEDLQLIENDPIPSPYTNSVVVHSYPSLKHVITMPAASSNIAGSLLSPNGQKIVLAVPEENKLKIWDVWARPALRRQASALSIDGRIR